MHLRTLTPELQTVIRLKGSKGTSIGDGTVATELISIHLSVLTDGLERNKGRPVLTLDVTLVLGTKASVVVRKNTVQVGGCSPHQEELASTLVALLLRETGLDNAPLLDETSVDRLAVHLATIHVPSHLLTLVVVTDGEVKPIAHRITLLAREDGHGREVLQPAAALLVVVAAGNALRKSLQNRETETVRVKTLALGLVSQPLNVLLVHLEVLGIHVALPVVMLLNGDHGKGGVGLPAVVGNEVIVSTVLTTALITPVAPLDVLAVHIIGASILPLLVVVVLVIVGGKAASSVVGVATAP